MIKSYDELRKLDVSPFVEKNPDGFSYLNWAKFIELLHDNGAEVVYFEAIPDEKTGSSLRMTETEFKTLEENIIKDGKLVEKKKLSLPENLINVITCKNPRCITTVESALDQHFVLKDRAKGLYRCKFCDAERKSKALR